MMSKGSRAPSCNWNEKFQFFHTYKYTTQTLKITDSQHMQKR